MSADIRTRRLIVTIPDVSGEEVDTLHEDINDFLDGHAVGEIAVATHALDDATLLGFTARWGSEHKILAGYVGIRVPGQNFHELMTTDDARKLAALILRAADEAEDGAR